MPGVALNSCVTTTTGYVASKTYNKCNGKPAFVNGELMKNYGHCNLSTNEDHFDTLL